MHGAKFVFLIGKERVVPSFPINWDNWTLKPDISLLPIGILPWTTSKLVLNLCKFLTGHGENHKISWQRLHPESWSGLFCFFTSHCLKTPLAACEHNLLARPGSELLKNGAGTCWPLTWGSQETLLSCSSYCLFLSVHTVLKVNNHNLLKTYTRSKLTASGLVWASQA